MYLFSERKIPEQNRPNWQVVLLVAMAVVITAGICITWFGRYRHTPVSYILATSDTIRDTTFLPAPPVLQYIPCPVLRDLTAEDTARIIADYFASYVFLDTLVHTDNLTVTVKDTVRENRLHGREVSYRYVDPVPVVVPTSPTTRGRNSIGISAYAMPESALVLIDYSRDRWRFSAGYDFRAKAPAVGVGYRLFGW